MHIRIIHSYEHCIGTCILSGKYYDNLTKNYNDFSTKDKEKYRLCVMIAALLHDLGHSVLGHSYPRYVKQCTGVEPTEHETMGILIFKRILQRGDIRSAFLERGLNEEVSELYFLICRI